MTNDWMRLQDAEGNNMLHALVLAGQVRCSDDSISTSFLPHPLSSCFLDFPQAVSCRTLALALAPTEALALLRQRNGAGLMPHEFKAADADPNLRVSFQLIRAWHGIQSNGV